jgi:hypothetical protein
MWQGWVKRSSKAVVILASPSTIARLLKLRFVVITTLARIVWLRADAQRWRQVC